MEMDIMSISSEEIGELVKKDPNMMMYLNLNSQVATLKDEMKMLKAENKTLHTKVDRVSDKVDSHGDNIERLNEVTFTLNTDGGKRKELRKLINYLCYKKYTGKANSIKDKLFHRTITNACYGRLYDQFEVSSYTSIKVDDFEEAKKVVNRWYSNSGNIEKVVRKRLSQYIEDEYLPEHMQKMVDEFMEMTNGGSDLW